MLLTFDVTMVGALVAPGAVPFIALAASAASAASAAPTTPVTPVTSTASVTLITPTALVVKVGLGNAEPPLDF
jgi:hypothetical protein